MAGPKKYIKVDGVMKLNPEYKKWKDSQSGGTQPATTVYNPYNNNNDALPIVTNMEDHEQINQASVDSGAGEIPLSEATNATIEMMQEPEISLEAGMQPDEMVDALGAIMNKYEVPMGLMNKLMMISEFQSLEFIVDDSGSMTLLSDTVNPVTKQRQTRWQEAHVRLKEMVEILAYVPFSQIDIVFLNRNDHVTIGRNGRDPKSFLIDAYQKIDTVFSRGPSGSTPALEKLQESFIRGQGKNIARYFFFFFTPNGGVMAQKQITSIVVNRQNPEGNPVTFLSCTNEDDQVEWMKDAEEIAPYCSESDDFRDEAEEVLRDQGSALPYSKGFHLICQLVAAMNPDDLDAMDESVPFTKRTLDNLLGIQNNEASYRHYFNCFIQAQRIRKIEGPTDQLKKSFNWESLYQQLLTAPVANQIPQVQDFKRQLKQIEGGPGAAGGAGGGWAGTPSYGGTTTTTPSYGAGTTTSYGTTPSAPPSNYDNTYGGGGGGTTTPPVVQGVAPATSTSMYGGGTSQQYGQQQQQYGTSQYGQQQQYGGTHGKKKKHGLFRAFSHK